MTEEFTEAVDVLSGMDVFQGDPGGTFRPGDNITRAEVAALIYRLATDDTGTEKMDLYTTTHPFTDVGASDWFAGYVGFCWNAGYIKGTTATTFNPYGNVTGYADWVEYFNMTYIETSKFIYEQTQGITTYQADLVILPKAAVKTYGSGNLFYVGDATPTLRNTVGEDATRFTFYDEAGNEQQMYVIGDSRKAGSDKNDAAVVAANSDHFFALEATDKKTVTDETIYRVVDRQETGKSNPGYALPHYAFYNSTTHYALDVIDRDDTHSEKGTAPTGYAATASAGKAVYQAKTYDSQNATINGDGTAVMYNVANAKVVNLNKDTYPGISDLGTLNNTSADLGNTVHVACVLDKDNPLIVTTIFVCFDQTA